MTIRQLARDDLPIVLAVQRRCYRADVLEPALVAVQGSEPFWRRHGFRPVRSFEYAERFPASYMVRSA